MIIHGEMIQTSKNHLDRDLAKRTVENFSHLIGQIYQDSIQDLGRPDLNLDAVDRPDPEVGQTQEAFHQVENIFDPPPLGIQFGDVLGRQYLGVEHIGQVAIPAASALDLDQTDQLGTLRFSLAQANHPVVQVGPGLQNAFHLINGIAFDAGHEPDARTTQLVKPGVVGKTQVEQEQHPAGQLSYRSFPEDLVMHLAVFFVPDLLRQHGRRTDQSRNPPCQHLAIRLPQQPDLAHQSIQGRTIQHDHVRETVQCPAHGCRERTTTHFPTLVHLRQDVHQHPVEQLGWKSAQSFRNSLLRYRLGFRPQHALLLQFSHSLRNRANLPPDQAQHKGHHDRQG